MNLVIDASVAIKWFAPELLSREAERLLDRGGALFAPDLLLVECGNIIWEGGQARRRCHHESW